MLLDKGYVKHVMDCRTMQLKPVSTHVLSTMVNLDHRYIHPDAQGEICFGLNEAGKPPTLISPRPLMEVMRDGVEVYGDDAMNIVLMTVPHEQILEAIYNHKTIKSNGKPKTTARS